MLLIVLSNNGFSRIFKSFVTLLFSESDSFFLFKLKS